MERLDLKTQNPDGSTEVHDLLWREHHSELLLALVIGLVLGMGLGFGVTGFVDRPPYTACSHR